MHHFHTSEATVRAQQTINTLRRISCADDENHRLARLTAVALQAMESQSLERVLQLAAKKETLRRDSIGQYLVRTILAGMFIGFGVIVAFKTGSYFHNVGSPMALPLAALTFSTAILLISFAGGDLFTGNAFYFAYAAMRKELNWISVIKLWAGSWLGNLAGCLLFALLIVGTGIFNEPTINAFLLKVSSAKMNAPGWELFFRGILCNWLICLAFFIPMSMKHDGPRIFMMILLVFCFFISGYEHSIANMCTFSVALLIDHPENISVAGFIHNLVPVTLGNLVGGAVMTGAVYWYLNDIRTGFELKLSKGNARIRTKYSVVHQEMTEALADPDQLQ
ncbi:MAG TPA: formate/nitrite transporter family protein [Chitinophagaceae bacterium]